MTQKHYKVLILEDSPLDLELIKNELTTSLPYDFEFRNVVYEAEFSEAITSFLPDIILSDFRLPLFSGFKAIKIVQEIDSYIPIIIVTGALPEEIAAESILNGAWDFVVKSRLNRLPIAFDNSLRMRNEKYKRRQVEIELNYVRKKNGIEIKLLYDAIDHAPDAVVITNIDGVIQYVNPSFEKITGYSSEEAIEKKLSVLKSGIHDNSFYDELWNTILAGREWRGDLMNKRKNGEIYRETMSIAPILDEKGRIFNFVAIKTDTTQQMLFEKEMLRAKEKAEENDKLKSAFLANISHEIRTPLNSIMGFSELLLGGNIEPETILAFAKIIHNSGKNLMSIISNVIQLSEIQSETVFVTQTPINVVDIIISIVREYSEDFQNKNIELAFKNTTPYKQIIIDTDAYKFHQIISKFVSNSLKFTEKGKVDIILEIKSENELEITVKDTGAGIKPELQHIIFEPFIRFDTFDNDFKKGIGLGLSIANSYAKMLNGNIKINSKPGEGAEFRFLLNTKITIITEQPVEYHGIENIFSDFTIVIAEDDNNNLKLIEQILEETGVHLICTRNGRELLEMLKKVPSISLILLDLNMPVKDGLEALKEIRTFNSEIPIIAQTAYTNEIETAYELGITNCITKPIDSALLIQILKRYLL